MEPLSGISKGAYQYFAPDRTLLAVFEEIEDMGIFFFDLVQGQNFAVDFLEIVLFEHLDDHIGLGALVLAFVDSRVLARTQFLMNTVFVLESRVKRGNKSLLRKVQIDVFIVPLRRVGRVPKSFGTQGFPGTHGFFNSLEQMSS